LIPVVAGYEEARFENMTYEKRMTIYFKKYIKDNLLLKLRNFLENPELPCEGLSKM
jgi:hypothetical protein